LTWPRLAEYFARYYLCKDLSCSLQISASAVSSSSLQIDKYIVVDHTPADQCNTSKMATDEWQDVFEEDTSETPNPPPAKKQVISACADTHQAIQNYLKQTVSPDKVAHVVVPIKTDKETANTASITHLEVSLAVHHTKTDNTHSDSDTTTDSLTPSLSLIRFINDMPILDSSEALSCGIVHALIHKRKLWNAFGLELAASCQLDRLSNMPNFTLKDNSAILSLHAHRTHQHYKPNVQKMLETTPKSSSNEMNVPDNCNSTESACCSKKRRHGESLILPVQVSACICERLYAVHCACTF
jgi:hypothetical protein